MGRQKGSKNMNRKGRFFHVTIPDNYQTPILPPCKYFICKQVSDSETKYPHVHYGVYLDQKMSGRHLLNYIVGKGNYPHDNLVDVTPNTQQRMLGYHRGQGNKVPCPQFNLHTFPDTRKQNLNYKDYAAMSAAQLTQLTTGQICLFGGAKRVVQSKQKQEKYKSAQQKYFAEHPLPQKFYSWQQQLWKIAQGQPIKRVIHWVVDQKGGAGKSHMAIWLKKHHGFMYMGINPQTKKFAKQYNLQRGVVFDLSRDSDVTKFNYGLLQKLKDGFLFASQYQGQMKFFPVPHVFVFSNSPPVQQKLTQNRWDIKII